MYEDNWNAYYEGNYRKLGRKALWDVEPERAVALDQRYFADPFDPGLPVVDLGCGTGEQSAYLRAHYDHVIGVDVATVAVEMAKENHQQEGLGYEFLDATRPDMAEALRARIGESNVYMRGVLHQILPEHLARFQEVLSILMGKRGCCYFNEVSAGIREYFTESSDRFAELPKRMQQVFISNLPPRGLELETVTNFFPSSGFKTTDVRKGKLETNLNFLTGEPIFIPSVQGLVHPA
ncbi:class I SAM-dependent methyltransferase [Neolewinella aurantiaca]|uniref:Class I SAM-dependent methyltransferase n=1 Tax=Neolewinella aurantiaca TaxID=2602767 RepID=A0A5C7FJ51_9BACT|nr:class I SAM-dependent methyltransferase [Neolewinella aurantiaca]TXF85446.1 class I SAM-dependent methyltransferase [Neolewinella aurantiaca]